MAADKTIVVSAETKEKMEGAKIFDRETMDDLINRLLSLLPKSKI